jgi:hypothetical protein
MRHLAAHGDVSVTDSARWKQDWIPGDLGSAAGRDAVASAEHTRRVSRVPMLAGLGTPGAGCPPAPARGRPHGRKVGPAMTITTAACADGTDPAPGARAPWPCDDVFVLRNRSVRMGTSRDHLSRFGDDLWHLRLAHPDAHASPSPIRWQRFPSLLRRAFKAFFFAALDQPYPVGPGGQRAGGSPASRRSTTGSTIWQSPPPGSMTRASADCAT